MVQSKIVDPIHDAGRLLTMREDPRLPPTEQAQLGELAQRCEGCRGGGPKEWIAFYGDLVDAAVRVRHILAEGSAEAHTAKSAKPRATSASATQLSRVLSIFQSLREADIRAIRYVREERLVKQRRDEIEKLMKELGGKVSIDEQLEAGDFIVAPATAGDASASWACVEARSVYEQWRESVAGGLLARIRKERTSLLARMTDTLSSLELDEPPLDLLAPSSLMPEPDLAVKQRVSLLPYGKAFSAFLRSSVSIVFLVAMFALPLGLKRETIVLPMIPLFIAIAFWQTHRNRKAERKQKLREAHKVVRTEILGALRAGADSARDEIKSELVKFQEQHESQLRVWRLDLDDALAHVTQSAGSKREAAPSAKRPTAQHIIDKLDRILLALERRVQALRAHGAGTPP
jgi:hypothetical protein